jgi:hypothetical protein
MAMATGDFLLETRQVEDRDIGNLYGIMVQAEACSPEQDQHCTDHLTAHAGFPGQVFGTVGIHRKHRTEYQCGSQDIEPQRRFAQDSQLFPIRRPLPGTPALMSW